MQRVIIAVLCVVVLALGFSRYAPGLISRAERTISRSIGKMRIDKLTYGYNEVSGRYASCLYAGSDSENAQRVVNMIDFYLPFLMNDFGIDDTETVTVALFENKQTLAQAVGATPEDVSGAYIAGYICLLSPSAWATTPTSRRYKQEGPVIHELTHYVMEQAGGYKNFERWFSEGMALYYEQKYTGMEWRADLSEDCKSIEYEELLNFDRLDSQLAYRRAYEIVRNYAVIKGENALQALLK